MTDPQPTEWRRTSRFYRRFPGLPWLIALIIIPLLLAVIGYGEPDRTRSEATGPTGALPTLNTSNPPGGGSKTQAIPPISLAPVSITRSGNDFKISGETASPQAKESLLAALKAGFGSEISLVDTVQVNPNITSLDFSNAAAVFKAAVAVTDFGLSVNGDTITLSGTADSGQQQNAIEQAATATWPNLNIVDTLVIRRVP